MGNPLFATKSLDTLMKEAADTGEHSLKRALGPVNLVTLGIGAIIGAGIFVLTGSAASLYAGPAIMLSYVLAGTGCVFAGLCYAEFASMIPIAGSAYTYGYATLGELVAWIIGWDLILEYAFGAATVASGWSSTLVAFLQDYGISLPPQICDVPGAQWAQYQGRWAPVGALGLSADQLAGLPHATASFNLVAFLAILGVTAILIIGIKESANFNSAVVFVKLAAVLTFIAVALPFVLKNPHIAHDNWKVFLPPNTGSFGSFGWSGVMRGASVVFFAYIGFDAVSTAAQEARNPQKDMPIGLLGSLIVCTILYIVRIRAADRNRALFPLEYRRSGLASHSRDWCQMGKLRDQRRCARGAQHGNAGHAARPISRLLFHGARRLIVEMGRRYPPAFSHALEVDRDRRPAGCHNRIAGADWHARPACEYRHAVCLRDRVRGCLGDASAAARTGSAL